jgi:hypothetical protein
LISRIVGLADRLRNLKLRAQQGKPLFHLSLLRIFPADGTAGPRSIVRGAVRGGLDCSSQRRADEGRRRAAAIQLVMI